MTTTGPASATILPLPQHPRSAPQFHACGVVRRSVAMTVWSRLFSFPTPGVLKAMTAAVPALERFGWLLAFCPVWHGRRTSSPSCCSPASTAASWCCRGSSSSRQSASWPERCSCPAVPGEGSRRGRPARGAGRRARPAADAEARGRRRPGAHRLRRLPERDRLHRSSGAPLPAFLQAPALALQIDQQWNMFSPEPARWSRFLVARGETAAGRAVDLLVDGQPRGTVAAMPPPSGRFGRDRWRAYFNYLRRLPADTRDRLGGRLRSIWDSSGTPPMTATTAWRAYACTG